MSVTSCAFPEVNIVRPWFGYHWLFGEIMMLECFCRLVPPGVLLKNCATVSRVRHYHYYPKTANILYQGGLHPGNAGASMRGSSQNCNGGISRHTAPSRGQIISETAPVQAATIAIEVAGRGNF